VHYKVKEKLPLVWRVCQTTANAVKISYLHPVCYSDVTHALCEVGDSAAGVSASSDDFSDISPPAAVEFYFPARNSEVSIALSILAWCVKPASNNYPLKLQSHCGTVLRAMRVVMRLNIVEHRQRDTERIHLQIRTRSMSPTPSQQK